MLYTTLEYTLHVSIKFSSAKDLHTYMHDHRYCLIRLRMSSRETASKICRGRPRVDSRRLRGTYISAIDFQYTRRLTALVSRMTNPSGSFGEIRENLLLSSESKCHSLVDV